MDSATVPAPPPLKPAARTTLGRRWFRGLGRTGFAIVAMVALITSLNTTTKFLVTWPFDKWFLQFLEEFAFHSFIGAAILLGAILARNRFSTPGATQYLASFVA